VRVRGQDHPAHAELTASPRTRIQLPPLGPRIHSGTWAEKRCVIGARPILFQSMESPPSVFWQRLGKRHEDLLEQFGQENIKRHQAFRYFTWSWRWYSLLWNRHFRFLITRTSPRSWLGAAREHQDFDAVTWNQLPGNRLQRWLYTFSTRLLWDYASNEGDRDVMRLGEPALGNPPPVTMGGAPISQDLANTALEVAAIRRAVGGGEPESILEIGAGYGRTAYGLLGVFPATRYTVIDIEPALSLARWYLTTLFPGRELTFLTPGEATPERLGRVDLALSISSLQEMTRDQIDGYLKLIDTVTDGVVFLKQWRRRTNWSDRITWRFSELVIPKRWKEKFREASPVQTDFEQAAWSVN